MPFLHGWGERGDDLALVELSWRKVPTYQRLLGAPLGLLVFATSGVAEVARSAHPTSVGADMHPGDRGYRHGEWVSLETESSSA